MKKAIKINLSGIVFHIDEDAYEKLKKYLDAISRHFSNKEEGNEIMTDIESRIAELFQEKITKEEEVINISMVNEVIEVMGDPEEIVDTGEESSSAKSSKSSSGYYSGSKRLHRDPDNSVIAGVCGGLGAYFNIDPILFRILFIVFFFFGGASIPVYIILWIVTPKAETAGQKLEMRGEPVNVSNIEKKVKQEYEAAKDNVKAAANSESVKKTKKAANNLFSDLGKILLVFVKVILIIIGTSFVIAGIGIIIGLVSGAFIGLQVFPFSNFDFTLADLLAPFTDPLSIVLLVISITLLFLIPVIAMIYGLIRIIFSIKSRNRGLTIGAVSLWFVALLTIVGILAIETGNYSDSGLSRTTNYISMDSDTLIVSVNERQKREFEKNLAFDFDLDSKWYISEDLDRIYGIVELDIEKSGDARTTIEIEKKSRGKSWESADRNASKLNYSYKTSENSLVLDPYFFLEGNEKWRFPELDITIDVPVGKYIVLDKKTRDILENVYNVDHVSDWRMGGKTWLMTEDGLKLVE